MVSNGSWPTHKWDILGLKPTDPKLLLTSWDIQVPGISRLLYPISHHIPLGWLLEESSSKKTCLFSMSYVGMLPLPALGWWLLLDGVGPQVIHPLKITAKAPENRQNPKRKQSYSNHPFQGLWLLVSGRLNPSLKHNETHKTTKKKWWPSTSIWTLPEFHTWRIIPWVYHLHPNSVRLWKWSHRWMKWVPPRGSILSMPLTYIPPPRNKALWSGLMKTRWYPLIRPY